MEVSSILLKVKDQQITRLQKEIDRLTIETQLQRTAITLLTETKQKLDDGQFNELSFYNQVTKLTEQIEDYI